MNAMSPIAVPSYVKIIAEMVCTAAERGDECPSSAVLASAAGCSVRTVVNAIALLQTMNIIRVEANGCWRVVTVVATGETTRKPPQGPHANAQAKRDANRRLRIEIFADALSEGATIKQAGTAAGVSEPTASKFFKTICAELGWVG